MTAARFEKWEGLGNDFVVLRDLGRALTDDEVRRICDRRFGVGADGVLLVETVDAKPRMIVRNADGSRPEMCGNGLRCVAGYLANRAAEGRLIVATDAGEKACEIVATEDGFDVTVEMGSAKRGSDLVAAIEGREHRFLTMDMGNPHAITFEAYEQRAIDAIGPAVATLPVGGTNVEFCREERSAVGPRIAVTVWERGVGRTLACGTGACAVAAAACDTGRVRFGEPVVVALPGGELILTVAPETRAVRMRGPARRVFTGEVVIR
ncbi:Diaminopimelate epimerase [Minicystis rosea]|nr:Diaminopimelate epimerase [Minicystis rosea]